MLLTCSGNCTPARVDLGKLSGEALTSKRSEERSIDMCYVSGVCGVAIVVRISSCISISKGTFMMNTNSVYVVPLYFFLSVALYSAQHSLPPKTIERLETVISSEMSRLGIPGMSIAVVVDHTLVWSNGYGFSDIENYVPAKSTTMYRIASISKPLTAVAVLQLAEQKKLDLDIPIQTYCVFFPVKRWPVTARQLLAHLGGIRHYKGDEFMLTRQFDSVIDGLSIFKDDSLEHEPGTKYLYSTYGYNLLGCVIEGASGMPYLEYMKKFVFAVAGMDRIRADEVSAIIPNRAQGYRRAPNGELLNSALANTSYKIPGGGFISTVIDLAKFAIAVQRNTLLKPATTRIMLTPQKTRDGKPASDTPTSVYALGWRISEYKGEREVTHSGSQQRVRTLLYMRPDRKFAIVLMCNLGGVNLMPIARTLSDIILEKT